MAAMGGATLLRPQLVFDTFGMSADSPEARNEVRAVYGGYGLAMSALLGWAAATSSPFADGVSVTVGAALAGMATGRAVSARIDPPKAAVHPVWTYFVVELAGAAALIGTSRAR